MLINHTHLRILSSTDRLPFGPLLLLDVAISRFLDVIRHRLGRHDTHNICRHSLGRKAEEGERMEGLDGLTRGVRGIALRVNVYYCKIFQQLFSLRYGGPQKALLAWLGFGLRRRLTCSSADILIREQ